MALYDSLTFMTQSQNIVWLGGTVVDKSGLAASFLILAINQGYSSRYVLFAELLAQFYRSCADHSEAKLACDVMAERREKPGQGRIRHIAPREIQKERKQ